MNLQSPSHENNLNRMSSCCFSGSGGGFDLHTELCLIQDLIKNSFCFKVFSSQHQSQNFGNNKNITLSISGLC